MKKVLISMMVVLMMVGAMSDLMAKGKPVTEDVIAKITEAMPEKLSKKPKKDRKVLIFSLCQGFPHGCIPVANKCFEIMGTKTGAYEPTVSQDMNEFAPENLKKYDAIIFNNTTRLKFDNQEHRKALMDFVKSGKGIVGIHGAADNFYNFEEAADMMGGLFDGHPWTANGTWAVKVEDPKNKLNAAFKGENFKIKDEIYQVKGPYSRETHHILLSLDLTDQKTGDTAKSGKRADKDYAVAWMKSCGKGRVFYSGLGHNNEIFWNPLIVKHYLDGIQWALGDLKEKVKPHPKKD